MRRRDFIKVIGGIAAAWPIAARAQQPKIPVVGFLNGASPDGYESMVSAFRQGLKDTGLIEGQNVAIEYRWAEGKYDRLPALVTELVRRQVDVIAATTTPAALAAKAATTTIPIVFEMAGDPVQLGLVSSLSRPTGNITGVTQLNTEVGAKRLQLLHELVPTARVFVLMVNPTDPATGEILTRDTRTAAQTLGLELHVLNASTERDFDAAFATVIRLRAGGLVIGANSFFTSRQRQLAALALRHKVLAIYENREFTAAGGLITYGGVITDAYRLTGVYVARILKGDKPADLPVQQSLKVQLTVNLKTARALGLTVPITILGRADEVIE